MRKLLGFLTALICTGTCLGTAYGAANEGGTLIMALSEGTVYTSDISDYCGDVTVTSCETAVTSGPSLDDDETRLVIHVLAAFPPPGGRLSGIVWGIDYDPERTFVIAYGSCGDFELANPDWPDPFSGTAITWFFPQTDPIVPVYWFNAYGYDGEAINLRPHPTQGALFADDQIPSQTDPIAGLGSFGFGSNPGVLVCPVVGQPEGACCFADGSCEIATADDCASQGGVYQG